MELIVYHCGEAYRTDDTNIGKKIRCWKCDEAFIIEPAGGKLNVRPPAAATISTPDKKSKYQRQRPSGQPMNLRRYAYAIVGTLGVLALVLKLIPDAAQNPRSISEGSDKSLALPQPNPNASRPSSSSNEPQATGKQRGTEGGGAINQTATARAKTNDHSQIPRRKKTMVADAPAGGHSASEPYSSIPTVRSTENTLAARGRDPDAKSLIRTVDATGRIRFALADSDAPAKIVRKDLPELPAGCLPSTNSKGLGQLAIRNGYDQDACVVVRGDGVQQQIYVKAKGSITLERIAPCACRVMFETGEHWIGTRFDAGSAEIFDDVFDYSEQPIGNKIEYAEYEITLNPVFNGSATTHPISRSEFEAAFRGGIPSKPR